MEFFLKNLDDKPYVLHHPQQIHTPRLLVFKDRVQYNLNFMEKLLAGAAQPLTLAALCPHVKTHKSILITAMMLERGIRFFKATPNEVAMLLQAGAKEIFIAYPLMVSDAEALAALMTAHPDVHFYVQLSKAEHAQVLQQAARNHRVSFSCFIDLDVGMARTGVTPQNALALYQIMQQMPELVLAGLHAYDGHIHQMQAAERQLQAGMAMDKLQMVLAQFNKAGVSIGRVVVAGTPGFIHDLAIFSRQARAYQLYFSPGTWILFDAISAAKMPATFKSAALILCQIVDQVGDNLYTLNMGHKRWAVDQGPIDAFSVPGMTALRWSEEHTVVQAPAYCRIGDYVLACPRHVCSTVNLWEYFSLIDDRGEVEINRCPIEGRNR